MGSEADGVGPRISYAQNGEDVRLWRALDDVAHGCYVEVGGWEPETDSISKSFYDRGWSGLIVEPVDEYVQQYASARPRDRVLQCLAGEQAGEQEFTIFPETGLSTTIRQHAERHLGEGLSSRTEVLPVQRLDDLLSELPPDAPIHFMTIDVEGAEESVIKGLSLERYRPWILVIESTEPRSTVRSNAWEPLILQASYQAAVFDGLNTFYVADEHAELASLLAAPPNPVDNYITVHHQRALTQLADALRQRDAANTELRVLAARLELASAQAKAARNNTALAEVDRDSHLRRALELEGELHAIRASTSWRLTAPLRGAKGRL